MKKKISFYYYSGMCDDDRVEGILYKTFMELILNSPQFFFFFVPSIKNCVCNPIIIERILKQYAVTRANNNYLFSQTLLFDIKTRRYEDNFTCTYDVKTSTPRDPDT